jgi:hypothetical protein
MIHRSCTPSMRRLASLTGIALLSGSALAWAALVADRPVTPARPELVVQIEDVRTQVERLSRTSTDDQPPSAKPERQVGPIGATAEPNRHQLER